MISNLQNLNRLCIGKQTNDDLRILQSRKVTQEQFETLHHIPHFFPTRRKVESYNESVLESSSQYTLTITAIDIPPSDILASAKENLQAAVNKRTAEKPGGLLRQVKIAVNHQYDLISNIAVHDGLMNGAECCIKYIQRQDSSSNVPAIIWVQFEDDCIGSEQCQNYSYLHKRGTISPGWMPRFAQKRTFLVKSVWVTCVQYPLCHAAAQTIHVAQSATFKSIYIDMQTNTNPPKIWWQHMHYVTLSRVTSLAGLYLKDLNEEKICISPQVVKYLENAR